MLTLVKKVENTYFSKISISEVRPHTFFLGMSMLQNIEPLTVAEVVQLRRVVDEEILSRLDQVKVQPTTGLTDSNDMIRIEVSLKLFALTHCRSPMLVPSIV